MASVRIVNASPLILLGKIRRLDLLFVVGTAGLVLRAKAEGLLAGSELVRDVLDSLEREGMYLGSELRASILEAADE